MAVAHEGSETTETDRVECLRLILEREQQRPVSYEEAREVGESLISFYETLAFEKQSEAAELITTKSG